MQRKTLALLLVCFTLFRPGFWMDLVHPPFDEIKGEAMTAAIEQAPPNSGKRVWVEGLNLNGDQVRKGVLLPLGPAGTAKERLASAGLTVMADGNGLMVAAVKFGSPAEKLGIEPRAVTLGPVALYNALAYDRDIAKRSEPFVFLDIGTASTDLVVAHGTRCWMRSFPLGGHIANSDTADFQFSEHRAGGACKKLTVFAAHGHLVIAYELCAPVNQAQCKV